MHVPLEHSSDMRLTIARPCELHTLFEPFFLSPPSGVADFNHAFRGVSPDAENCRCRLCGRSRRRDATCAPKIRANSHSVFQPIHRGVRNASVSKKTSSRPKEVEPLLVPPHMRLLTRSISSTKYYYYYHFLSAARASTVQSNALPTTNPAHCTYQPRPGALSSNRVPISRI
ncbi:hypothetical protein BDY21DRAFT_353237 [Lineolata rhizophorae]|uniref:Uncharacterized protein n=1 Tax=Lineolata rhizophorae TaxID=578093 RepID=A0A6A6NQU4_9PEZI|nr:hypothetical protein BDY21DRAFT_353237 [Lineolata rhizophorae]